MEVLDIGQRTGSTDYIDFVRSHEMRYEVMIGRDIFKRSFVCVRHPTGVLTFFQRYSDIPYYFTTGGQYPPGIDGCGGITLVENNRGPIVGDSRFRFLLIRLSEASKGKQ
jgi:hypothetical protein